MQFPLRLACESGLDWAMFESNAPFKKGLPMPKLLRYYAVLSLVVFLATAALLVWYYRQAAAIRGITQHVEHSWTEFAILAGALLIMAILYAVLIVIMRRAGKIIEQQQRTIRERTEFLQLLSTQMLASEESYKKSIAHELHEELAQTLAGIKLHVEKGRHRKRRSGGVEDPIIPALQEAIRKTRTIAKDLRPPGLDDFGLLPTLNNFSSKFEQKHPGIRFKWEFTAQEHEIPAALKIVLYRIINSVLDDMTKHAHTQQIYLGLWTKDSSLVLLLADTENEALDKMAIPLANIDPQSRAGFANMEALTTLSGGDFSASRHAAGGTTLRGAWNI
jgi:signal transduction histidine kinase